MKYIFLEKEGEWDTLKMRNSENETLRKWDTPKMRHFENETLRKCATRLWDTFETWLIGNPSTLPIFEVKHLESVPSYRTNQMSLLRIDRKRVLLSKWLVFEVTRFPSVSLSNRPFRSDLLRTVPSLRFPFLKCPITEVSHLKSLLLSKCP